MTRIELAPDAPHRVNARGILFKQGAPREVNDDRAAQLLDGDLFVPAGDDPGADADADVIEFDVESFVAQNAGPQVKAIKAGDVDAHLDAIADANEYATVSDAISARRAELEG